MTMFMKSPYVCPFIPIVIENLFHPVTQAIPFPIYPLKVPFNRHFTCYKTISNVGTINVKSWVHGRKCIIIGPMSITLSHTVIIAIHPHAISARPAGFAETFLLPHVALSVGHLRRRQELLNPVYCPHPLGKGQQLLSGIYIGHAAAIKRLDRPCDRNSVRPSGWPASQ